MFVQVTSRIHGLRNPILTSVLLEELESLFLGQALDLSWKVATQCPSKEDYLAMVDRETGSMFRLVLHLLIAARDHNRSNMSQFDDLARLLGR
ncbi:geranylgeranyl pyrophosphate synthase [Ophiocordyceps camponoti-floridani]|uniref:Geranylgeranyl pyrophosphate synthase n=1 Tax=Ophiocordyceps camponoti-floridani TaxID=2030778 RepID=A0A8H4VCW2_9HYPO|nr:geranylgeranyl pyrophosphate synthase [Ophiocordyceps camponoti-floridani]